MKYCNKLKAYSKGKKKKKEKLASQSERARRRKLIGGATLEKRFFQVFKTKRGKKICKGKVFFFFKFSFIF